MSHEISHQRLNFRFLKDYLLWRACEKPSLKHVELKKEKKKRERKSLLLLQISRKQFTTKKSANE